MALSKDESCHKKHDANEHVSLPQDLIDKLKNVKSWDEWPCRWTFDEEKMNMPLLWPHDDVIGDYHLELHQFQLANHGVEIAEQKVGTREFDQRSLINNEEN
ncbi:hypothetical protein PHJA_002182000 [Phtheirospermum japonicum]|uniref:Uncharacterized protein n=1 Tax=Phtheirospermum japonicum TaxID=374723 RepID=A0A830CN12_9LAMI|nr:hypothetical protein PHJA_002182000 [Phtheirospermum japonicum]